VPRVDVSGKVNGSARYAIDVQVPKMRCRKPADAAARNQKGLRLTV